MKKIIPKIVIAIIFIFIVLLFQYSNNQKLNDNQKLNENSIVENDISKYNCDLEIISNIPNKSTVIAGHIYSWDKSSFFNQTFINFLEENKSKINFLIINGDVFHKPSLTKWEELKQIMINLSVKFLVVPGNHDVDFGDNSLRDVFFKSFDINFPHNFEENILKNFEAIALDSTENFDFNKLEKLINLDKNNIIIQHHSPIADLEEIANSLQYLDLLKLEALGEIIKNETIFILGDFGIHKSFFCLNYNNLKIIGSGFGRDDKEVIVINNNKIYRYIL